MNAWTAADHPRGDGGRFKTKPRTEPEGELEADGLVSAPSRSPQGVPARFTNPDGELHRTDGPAITRPDGTQEWWLNGRRHREDGPAVTRPDGTQEWWLNGWLHRTDGPAVTWPSGRLEWWENGVMHREDGPAVIHHDGTLEWFEHGVQKPPEVEAALTMLWHARTPNAGTDIKRTTTPILASTPRRTLNGVMEWRTSNGKLHREDGPAVTRPDGGESWYFDGKAHRVDGPALIGSDGSEVWYLNGDCHRLDGPSFTRSDGHQEWSVYGRLHRVDGPAVIRSDGTLEWWEDDVRKPPEMEAALTMVWKARTPKQHERLDRI